MAVVRDTNPELVEVRRSKVHGLGVFAAGKIRKGTRLIEYIGERVTHEEADRRYDEKDENDNHTFLFIVDSKTVIDAGVEGNDARFFNHSCDPNCESVVQKKRVFIEATRNIEPGTELTYDYQIQRDDDDPENIDEVFACRCGFAKCRGTMLWPTERKAKRKKKTRNSAGRTVTAKKKKTQLRSKGKKAAAKKTVAKTRVAKTRAKTAAKKKRPAVAKRAGRRG